MGFYTKAEARAAAKGKIQVTAGRKTADQMLNESWAKASDTERYDVFLSHSIRDSELVLGVLSILEGLGFKVYVDWINDPQASRENVTKETAALIRKRMQQSKSLIFIATDNASESKWMPWELGYFDGHSAGTVAILPLMDSATSAFKGQQYLGLYPLVEKRNLTGGGQNVFVIESGSRWAPLSKFGKGQQVWSSFSKV